jgi:FkbM family methyltransferase
MNPNKSGTAVVFSLTSNMTFALASVLMDLKEFSRGLANDIVVFHDGIKQRDRELLNSILPVKFTDYNFPIKDLSKFKKDTLDAFSTMVFAKFECFRLLNYYNHVIYLDYDQVIRADLSDLLVPCESGIRLIPSTTSVVEGLFYPVDSYDMDIKSICSSIIVLHDNLKDYDELYSWCYRKTYEYAGYLHFPEQAIIDFMLQSFNIVPCPISSRTYCCHPRDVNDVKSAKVIHAYGQPKFWNGITIASWNNNYQKWIRMGGQKYKNARRSILKRGISKVEREIGTILRTLKELKSILQVWRLISNNSILYRYFLSQPFKANRWTFAQCRNFALRFEEMFYRDDFIERFADLLSGVDHQTTSKLKFLFERMLFLAFLNRDSLFDDQEKENWLKEVELAQHVTKNESSYEVAGLRFVENNMTIHNFIDDFGLSFLGVRDKIMDRDIIDVGAYIGDSSLVLSRYTKGKVHAFEPFDKAFSDLLCNIELNNANGIIPVKLAASNTIGRKRLYFAKNANLSVSTFDPEKSLTKGDYGTAEIETTTIDHYSIENGLRIGAIKIDAEGAEKSVLAGASEVIRRDKPVLLISIYHNVEDFMDIKPWVDSLKIGYSYKICKPESSTFIEETMLVCY